MIVSIHQPNYLPWLGFFSKIKQSDLFVLFDDVQFPRGKKHFGHRNRIKTNFNASKWLTVPIKNKSDMVSFNDTVINYSLGWNKEHLRLMEIFYKEAPHFDKYFADISELLLKEYSNLTELSKKLIVYFMKELKINTEVKLSSEFGGEVLTGSDKIFNILEKVRSYAYSVEYISGSGEGSRRYIEEGEFKRRRINLHWQEYEHPTYNQLFNGFMPYLSVVDLLFNEGNESYKII